MVVGGVTLVEWNRVHEDGPLMGAIHEIIDWEIAEEQVATPAWYRSAAARDREMLTRLNTDFRALYELSKEELNIPRWFLFHETR